MKKESKIKKVMQRKNYIFIYKVINKYLYINKKRIIIYF